MTGSLESKGRASHCSEKLKGNELNTTAVASPPKASESSPSPGDGSKAPSIVESRSTANGDHSLAPQRQKPGRLQTALRNVLWYLKEQWFLVALGILIAIASQHQVPESHQALKSTVVTYLCVSIIFLITGCTLPTKTLLENYSRWKLHLFVQVQCFLMTSAVIFGVVSAAASNHNFMDPGLLIGLIFTGCTATTISSNVVMTGKAGGNTALTVVQSTLGNFLGPFLTPALIAMYTSSGAWYTKVLPDDSSNYQGIYRRVFKQLGLSIFVPLVAGQIVQNLFPGPTKKIFAKYKLSKLGSIMLLVIIWQTYDAAFQTGAFTSVKGSNIVFIIFVSVALFFLLLAISFFSSIAWLSKEDTIAACYCIPAKTPAMGVPLATVMFVGIDPQLSSKLQIPMVLYQGLQILGGSILTTIFRAWLQRSKEAEKKRSQELENGENVVEHAGQERA